MKPEESVEHGTVRCQSIGPPILAKLSSCLLSMRDLPRQHGLECSRRHEIVGHATLGLGEGFAERLSDPGMRAVERATNDDGVHDGKDLGLAEISAFHLDIILEKPAHGTRVRAIGRRGARRIKRIDTSFREETRERLVRADLADPEAWRQVERELLLTSRF